MKRESGRPSDPPLDPVYLRRLMHDLMGPVRHVTLFSEFVDEALADPVDLADARKSIRTVREAARALSRLTQMVSLHMRTIQALANGSTTLNSMEVDEPFPLAELMGECWASLEGDAAALSIEGDVITNVPRSVMKVVCEQVLSNAIGFADESRGVNVNVSIEQVDGDTVLIVTDNGIGIDMELADQARQPFERLGSSDEGHGAGLGLTIAIMWVESWGGTLAIDSDGASGTTITIRWPPR